MLTTHRERNIAVPFIIGVNCKQPIAFRRVNSTLPTHQILLVPSYWYEFF